MHLLESVDIFRREDLSMADVDIGLKHAVLEQFHGLTVLSLRGMYRGKFLHLLFSVRDVFEGVGNDSHFDSGFAVEHDS